MVFVPQYNRRLFPLILQPFKDELFTSWLCRLSINHGVKPHTFAVNYLGNDFSLFNRDLDLYPPKKILNFFSSHCPEYFNISQLFLQSYEGYAFESFHDRTGYISNVLPIGIEHRKRKRFGIQFCPSCLRKHGYFKKQWRLITSVICVECKEYLIDRCPCCEFPIAFHRVFGNGNSSGVNGRKITECYECGSKLYLKQTNLQIPNNAEIEFQQFMDDTLNLGFNRFSNYSFSFFKTFLFLAFKLRSNRSNNRFRSCLTMSLACNLGTTTQEVKFWSVKERRETFLALYRFLNIDRKDATKTMKQYKVTPSYVDPEKVTGFWFYKYL